MAFRLTKTVKWLVILCFAFFVIEQTCDKFFDGNLIGWFALVPSGFMIDHRFWQIVTYAFLHGDVMHLFLNMLMLVFIGSELEALWGAQRFIRFYFFCSISAGFVYLLMQAFLLKDLHAPMVGASGGIYGLLMAYGLVFGERSMLFMMMFPMKAKHFVWILAGIEFMTGLYSGRSGMASVAHLGGMAAGFGYLWVRATWVLSKKRRAETPKSKKKGGSSHLKLVVDNPDDPSPKKKPVKDKDRPTFH
jgi:membrane associated rhomboid family serine protease